VKILGCFSNFPMLTAQKILDQYRQLADQNFTVVDLETTGGVNDRNHVIEICVIHANLSQGITSQYTDLINPRVLVPRDITYLTGITQDMVESGQPPETLWIDYLDHLNQGVFTAHNLSFDYNFIKLEYRRLGINFVRPPDAQLCTVLLSRLLLPHLKSRSLPNLVKHFKFNVGKSHRAEADTLACWLLLEKLFEQLAIEDQELLLDRIGQQWLGLEDVAQLLAITPLEAKVLLEQQNVSSRYSQHRRALVYQRGSVESLLVAQD
jgi:DNA polymerase III subunit epsilon